MKVKILVIDDHPGTLDIITMTLERHGYEVLSATSGEEGLKLARRYQPELVLLDIMMPDMDGLEVCRRLRQMDEMAGIPIIMFTALSQAEDKLAGFAAGADDYLAKPTRPNELLRRVRSILARREEEKQAARPAAPAESSSPATEKVRPVPASAKMAEPQERVVPDPPLAKPLSISLGPTGQDRLIAVMGVCGGAGTTTTAINVAVSLADLGEATTLVDLDMEQGHVALHLGWKKPGGLNTLVDLSGDAWQKKLDEQLIVYGNQLQLLLAQPNMTRDLPILESAEALQLVKTLRENGRCVVADVGRGLNPLSRTLLPHASEIVICLRPDRVAILAAKQLIRFLHNELGEDAPIYLLLLSFTGRSNFPVPIIEDFIGHTILDELIIDAQEVTRAVNKGLPLVRINEEAPVAVKFREIAGALIRQPS
jgi:CheY-like chemotaxis protein/MinD-like ATPase involved in chromosome partitioning or flagellar assembly